MSATFFRAMKGWLAGCGAATAVVCAFYAAFVAMTTRGEGLSIADMVLMLPVLIFLVTGLVSGIPAALVIWLSEKFAIRSILFFACAGAVIGTLGERVLFGAFRSSASGATLLFAVAGLVAGTVYWHIAGRFASPTKLTASVLKSPARESFP